MSAGTYESIQWDEVIEDLGPALLRYFLGAGFSRAQSSDGVQETLLRLVRLAKEGEYDPNRGSPRMLAFGIARLVKHEFYRSVGEHDLFGDAQDYANKLVDPGGQDALEDHQSDIGLRKAIRTLDYPVREIFLLLIDRELRLEEIAGILSIPTGTVKSHIHRGKEKLKAILESSALEKGKLK